MIVTILCGVAFAILIHLGAGHSVPYILDDLRMGMIILIGGIAAIFSFAIARQIRRVPSHIWERNRQASILAKKVNKRKELTAGEQQALDRYLHQRILTATPYVRNNMWHMHLKLSNCAIGDVLRC